MENKIIETLNPKVIAVEVPKTITDYKIIGNNETPIHCLYIMDNNNHAGMGGKNIDLPKGKWNLLGFSNELTEEQKELCCEEVDTIIGGYLYNNYLTNKWTNIESAYTSLKQASGMIDENKYGEMPPTYYPPIGTKYDIVKEAEVTIQREQWQSEQEKVKKYLIILNEE